MTFNERQHRLSRLSVAMAAIALIPLLLHLLDAVQFTPAGMLLYTLVLLAVGCPGLVLAVQHARALHRDQTK